MSQELFYTSAPKGLKPGSHGYCTVAATSGMAPNVADKLESLSAYRHIFAAGSGQEAANPVVYSYLRLVAGGRTYFVLSRIADAGLDYTQRNNKFAHHVALDAAELPPAGPAWLLAQDNFLVRNWTGEPRIIPAGRKPPQGNLALGICRAWEAATGDAGWAGVLAESATRATPVFLIIDPSTNILPLLVEAQSLLAPKQRWGVTMSTYYTKLPTGVECQWRCVLKGSPEAKGARTIPGSLIIDLTRKLGAASGGLLVEAARTGTLQIESGVQASETVHTADPRKHYSAHPPNDYKVRATSSAASELTAQSGRRLPQLNDNGRKTRRLISQPWVVLGIASLLLFLGVLIGLLASTLNSGQASTNPAANPVASTPNSSMQADATSVQPPKNETAPNTNSTESSTTSTGTKLSPNPEADDKAALAPSPTKNASSPPPSLDESQFAEPRVIVLDLPEYGGKTTSLRQASTTIPFSIKDASIRLHSPSFPAVPFKLELKPSSPTSWELKRIRGTVSNVGNSAIGEFRFQGQFLWFEWGPRKDSDNPTELLRDSALQLISPSAQRRQLIVFRRSVLQSPILLRSQEQECLHALDGDGLATLHKPKVLLLGLDAQIQSGSNQINSIYQLTPTFELEARYEARKIRVLLRYQKSPISVDGLRTERERLTALKSKLKDSIEGLEKSNTDVDPVEVSKKIETQRSEQQLVAEQLADLEDIELCLRRFDRGVNYNLCFSIENLSVEIANGVIRIEKSKK